MDGLNIDAIGVLFGVHRATVARWRSDARTALFEGTRRVFRAELDLSAGEFASVMRLIDSQLEVSLPRLLEGDETGTD
jgi:RNA polymerase sigma-70 factor (ECF subfamily)